MHTDDRVWRVKDKLEVTLLSKIVYHYKPVKQDNQVVMAT